MGELVSRMRQTRNAHRILADKPLGKRPLGIREENGKILREML
jgi:hypothetical protein